MPESPDTQNRLYAAQDRARRDLLRDVEMNADFPGGVIVSSVDVYSAIFERILPELLAYSQKRRVEELAQSVGRLSTLSSDLLKASDRLYNVTKALLAVAVITLSVALVSLGAALLR